MKSIEKWLRKHKLIIDIPLFNICILWYNAWPDGIYGTNYWMLELTIGTPKRCIYFLHKIDFWTQNTYEL